MQLYLALSCLQGRPRKAAVAELWALGPSGLQLCPGNPPGEPDFEGIPLRFHHGYSALGRLRAVYNEQGRPLVGGSDWSVHPPPFLPCALEEWLEGMQGIPVETMYPGQPLGTGPELLRAMQAHALLAVDVSHLYIQLQQGVLSPDTLKKLYDYPQIAEIHVSANNGQSDQHQPMEFQSFGLDWAFERSQSGLPVILECYMHALDPTHRLQQLAYCRRER